MAAVVVVRVCVRLDGFVGCEYGRLCVDFGGRMRRKEIWELLSALVMSRSRGSQPGTLACTDLCPLGTESLQRQVPVGQLRSIDIPTALDPSPVILSRPPSQSRFQSQNPPWPVAGPIATFTCPQGSVCWECCRIPQCRCTHPERSSVEQATST